MKIAILFFLIILFLVFPSFRCLISHPFSVVGYTVVDLVTRLRTRSYNIAPTGFLTCYEGHFGKGKTLSAVHDVFAFYKRYNNKRYIGEIEYKGKKYKGEILQRVIVLSNVHINGVPTVYLDSLQKIVDFSEVQKKIDYENSTRTVVYVLIDEASVLLNSRNFKSNINGVVLNALLTCRHYNLNICYTSQKFRLTDALLRSVTQKVVNCNKIWRVQTFKVYNADEVDNAGTSTVVKPVSRCAWFVKNKDYNRYDTTAVVSDMDLDAVRQVDENKLLEMLSAENHVEAFNPTRRYRKKRK